jgi:4-hydroxymandelate oxidase
MAHPDGELGTAVAAAAQGAGLVLSTQASTPLEAVAGLVPTIPGRGPLWFQLYLQHDRGFTLELVRRAEAAGYEALVLTVDAPCNGARDRERRAGFRLPPGISAVNLDGFRRPRPSAAPRPERTVRRPAAASPHLGRRGLAAGQHPAAGAAQGRAAPGRRPRGRRLQVAGLIVSNHGGRTLDTLPSTAEVLPAIVEALRGSLPVLVDGGIRRGTDVLKALALGASAC